MDTEQCGQTSRPTCTENSRDERVVGIDDTEKLAIEKGKDKRHQTRRRKLRDRNAPPPPRNGYLLYMVSRRKDLVLEKPTLSIQEINRELAHEWNSLESNDKQRYLKEAAEEKRKYEEAFEQYKKTDSYKQFRKLIRDKDHAKRKRDYYSLEEDAVSYKCLKPGDVPIFTLEFLEHCRERDTELRRLRKDVVQLEEEENALEQRITKLKGAIKDVEKDTQAHSEEHERIGSRVKSWKEILVNAFGKVPLPKWKRGPSLETIDNYIRDLRKIVLECPDEHQDFLIHVRSIISRLKFPENI